MKKKRGEDRVRTCRRCGCTDKDCSACIATAGEPCHWVEDDLCSACHDGWQRFKKREVARLRAAWKGKVEISPERITAKMEAWSKEQMRRGWIKKRDELIKTEPELSMPGLELELE